MDDEAILVEHLVVDDEMVCAFERIGVLIAVERERLGHGLAAKRGVGRGRHPRHVERHPHHTASGKEL